MPRLLAAIVIGAIAVASLAAAVWPSLADPEAGADRRWSASSAASPMRPDQAACVGAAPVFEWNAPDGMTRRLSDRYGGVVVVNFSATRCVHCRTEMPGLERIAASSDTVFLAVDLQEDSAKVRSFMGIARLARLQPLLDMDCAVARRCGVVACRRRSSSTPRASSNTSSTARSSMTQRCVRASTRPGGSLDDDPRRDF